MNKRGDSCKSLLEDENAGGTATGIVASANAGSIAGSSAGSGAGSAASGVAGIAGGIGAGSGDAGTGAGAYAGAVADLAGIPQVVRASVASTPGVYDARRLRSQREIIRDVMLSAADCETWLTLGELRALTRYGEASISAQLRHLRKSEHGGYEVAKRHREGASPLRPGTDGRGEMVWEYRIARGILAGDAADEARAVMAGV